MGHLYRQLHFSALLAEKGEKCIFFLNDNAVALKILADHKVSYETVPLNDWDSGWEKRLVKKHRIDTWVDDRLDTDVRHAQFVKESGAVLSVFDDHGTGAALADFNFSALSFDKTAKVPGKKVFVGTEYLILNPEIDSFKRLRTKIDKILITLGGSDTYGVTLKAIDILRSLGRKATIVTGPSFEHQKALKKAANGEFKIKPSVPSLIAEFADYDLAICGGGITPFEASASGLPCLIIANEPFEIPNGRYLESLGTSLFAGHHANLDSSIFNQLPHMNLSAMSQAGLSRLDTKGAQRIYDALKNG